MTSKVAKRVGSIDLNDNVFVSSKRAKATVNISLEDFSRVHGHFSDKHHPLHIETGVFSLPENDKIKYQFRLIPGKHDLHFDALYKGTEPSANLLIDVYMIDKDGRKYSYEYNRKVDIQIGSRFPESVGNFIYDRDDLERKREKLFTNDKLTLCVEVNAAWCQVSDKPELNE